MPEELTGSTSTSIMSCSISPDRETKGGNMTALTSRLGPDICCGGTGESSFSSLSVESPEGPPSPNTSQSRIFDILCSNAAFSGKLASSPAIKGNGLLSPTVTGQRFYSRRINNIYEHTVVTAQWHHPVLFVWSLKYQQRLLQLPLPRNNSKKGMH
uniref:Uncharacterized protein n=1 Tax=Heterorhabditis bacteriophora TaxID=37862 RepID=A0A1I7WGM5_HETBA